MATHGYSIGDNSESFSKILNRHDSFTMEMNIIHSEGLSNSARSDSLGPVTPHPPDDSKNQIGATRSLSVRLLRAMTANNSPREKKEEIDERSIDRESVFSSKSHYFDLGSKPIVAPKFRDNMQWNEFSELKEIGCGAHSTVNAGIFDKHTAVIKVVSESFHNDPVAQQEFNREIVILTRINHTNILKIYGTGYADSKNNGRPVIVLEYLQGGTLKHHLSIRRNFFQRPFTELRYLRMATEFIDALYYLHTKFDTNCTLIHRDLKPDNIGFTSDGTLKLLDFGLCIALKKNTNSNATYTLTGCTGSLRYMAPEVALNQTYNEKVDIYSYGILLYEIITGVAPFKGLKRDDFYTRVVTQHERPAFDYDDYGREVIMRPILQKLIQTCWDPAYLKRPSAAEVYEQISTVYKDCMEEDRNSSFFSKTMKSIFTKPDSI